MLTNYLAFLTINQKSGDLTRQHNLSIDVLDIKNFSLSQVHQSSSFYSMFNMNLSNVTKLTRQVLFKEFENELIEQAQKEEIGRFVVGGVAKNKNNQVLILKRAATDFLAGLDELPSGRVEKNETLTEALIREIKEETNLDIKLINRYLGHFDYKSKSGTLTRQFNFEIEVSNLDELKISEEHEQFNWIKQDELKDKFNISESVQMIIEKFYKNNH